MEYINREDKIKTISFFFATRYNDTLSEKVLSIINNYNTLDYTVNSNGIFINLNFLDNDILDMIYYVVNDYKKEINMNDVNDNINYISIPSITYSDSFTKQAENIEYNDVDNFVLDLSTRVLTI